VALSGHPSTTRGLAPSTCGPVHPRVPRLLAPPPPTGLLCCSTACCAFGPSSTSVGAPSPPEAFGPARVGPWINGWDTQSLASSFSTMTLAPPTMVSDWVADSGASYHTTPDAGILVSTSPPHPSLPSSIVVGNSSALPFTSVGTTVLPGPFRLTNVLVVPNIIQNLLSVRQFTTDNSCSMEFDPFGLSVKHLATRTLLAWCDSPGPLYTLRLPASPTSTSALPVLAAAASSVTWHHRLGHPGHDVMSKLSNSTSVSSCRGSFEHICHACQLGRHVRLPFPTSSS
jgi:hypothetical protein